MKIKMEKIYSAIDVFKKLMNQDLPVEISYKFTNLFKDLNSEFSNLEKKRLALVKKYGTEQETGEIKVEEDTKKDKFLKEFNKILEKQVDLKWELTSLKKLGEKATLTVPELNSISFLFSEFEEAKEKKPANNTSAIT